MPLPQSPTGPIHQVGWQDPPPVPLPPASALDAPAIKSLTVATGKSIQLAEDLSSRDLPVYRTNSAVLATVTVTPPKDAKNLSLIVDGGRPITLPVATPPTDVVFANVDLGTGREHVIKATGDALAGLAAQIQLNVRLQGALVEGYSAPGFGSGTPVDLIAIRFSAGSHLKRETVQATANYAIAGLNGLPNPTITGAVFDPISDTVTLSVTGVKPGSYTLAIPRSGTIVDQYGNPLQPMPNSPETVHFTATLFTQTLDQLPLPTQGVALQHGPYVPMHEYQTRPPSPAGFNRSSLAWRGSTTTAMHIGLR